MNKTQKSIAKKYYWYSIFMIIPPVALILGILLLRKGILLKDRILCLIGAFGILLAPVFFVGVMLYSEYSDNGKAQRVELAKISLDEVMRDMEFYKLQFGYYPDSLQELEFVDKTVFIKDALSRKGIFSTKENYLNYKKIDSAHYTLFSAGLDRIPYTADDIYPFVPVSSSGKSGLIKQSN